MLPSWPGAFSDRAFFSADANFAGSSQSQQNALQVITFDGDAAFCRKIAISRDMQKNGTASTLHARPHVVVEHDNEIVQSIAPKQSFCAGWIGMFDATIVIAIANRIAPAIMSADRIHRQSCPRASHPSGMIEDANDRPCAARAGPITFALNGSDAATAKCARDC
jgi:hypothetical protein